MKNILILHGSYSSPDKNWYQYVGQRAHEKGYSVNIPQLPGVNQLDVDETYSFLFTQNLINTETTLVGHSSGATYILGILQKLPAKIVVEKAILVGGLIDVDLTEALFKEVPKSHYKNLFPKKWDWKKIKESCRKFVIFHAPDDPYVQMRHAKELHKRLGGKLVIVKNGRHFSVNSGGERFKVFPEILPHIFE